MSNTAPLLIGITGGIGSGKSTVAKIFEILGIPVYYADDRAKWLMANDPTLIEDIKNSFGNQAYLPDGSLNRAFLADEIFSNDTKTELVNSLVHPAVKLNFETWVASQNAPYVLKEAALLFESGSNKDLDKIITVSSPLLVRVNRVLMRDPHRSEAQLHAIIDKQLPDEEKISKSDFSIKNTDNKLLIPQVLDIHQKLLKYTKDHN
ncbi:dephospho-CoA kinase [Belliella kenyensis]|uniref:Dephospho-CoA kinase n=1 Tax=Belliella kenyensis TaxID=1472724 RepID=A0ABV8EH93_9BACT|nr:dephospho-CoA kinase [Belliella kenyensis]MCH7402359.1 dephospho-CoA kinase [Belliella kenyensis]MDN3603551.1 dephospho-CoA kinase [Belliella kenyensis]